MLDNELLLDQKMSASLRSSQELTNAKAQLNWAGGEIRMDPCSAVPNIGFHVLIILD